MERYFGSYQKIQPSSKKEGALLLSADNVIGDSYEIIFDGDLAWAKNRFGARVGHFTIDFSRQLRDVYKRQSNGSMRGRRAWLFRTKAGRSALKTAAWE